MPLTQLSSELLTALLTKMILQKLANDGTMRLLDLRPFGNNPLNLNKENSLLIDFQGFDKSAKYRLLVCLTRLNLLNDSERSKIARTCQLLRTDLGVFWSTSALSPEQTHMLKREKIDVLTVPLPKSFQPSANIIRDFVYDPTLKHEQMFAANLLANDIITRLRKKFHLVLSEVAAPHYDEYGKDSVATQNVMEFETELLAAATAITVKTDRHADLAVDVGCGDGRHTRSLAKRFKEVVAFDFSPRMIDEAQRKDRLDTERDFTNITYYVNDFEYEEFPEESGFMGRVDFICASFGMGSFVENAVGMLRRFYRWLRPGGRLFLSYYNAESTTVLMQTPWRDTALAAALNPETNSLEVRLTPTVRFSIYCKPANATTLQIISSVFTVENIYSYPHIMGVLPNAIFTNATGGEAAKTIIARADRVLADDKDIRNGQYLMLVARKESDPEQGHLRILEYLERNGIVFDLMQHEPVVSIDDVIRLLAIPEHAMVKTVVFKSRGMNRTAMVAVSARKRVDVERLAIQLNEPARNLFLLPTSEIKQELGYPIGGIGPFCFADDVLMFIDEGIFEVAGETLWMGVGDNRKTLKIAKKDFAKLCEPHRRLRLAEDTRGTP